MEKKVLKGKNYIGYASCDLANNLGFSAMSAFLTVFYMKNLGIDGWVVSLIMILARIWDGINDPMMGFIAQKAKPTKYGKYRHFLLIGGIPYAISSVLIFTWIPGASYMVRVIYAAFTYILYGMIYTVLLVPYGSLANVMTLHQGERCNLSTFRSIGAGIGNIPCALIFPALVYTTEGDFKPKTMVMLMSILAVVMILFYILSFLFSKENVPSEENPHKIQIKKVLKEVIHNRAFVVMSILGCLLIASSQFINTINQFLFTDLFKNSSGGAAKGLLPIMTIITYAPMVIMIPFVGLIVRKFGKKEMNVLGFAVSTVASLALFILRSSNPWVYMAFSFFINMGVGFLTLQVWSMAADVIDHQELVTGRREESANYALFTFMRKVGQALAATAPLLLQLVGYQTSMDSDVSLVQTPSAIDGMYFVGTLVPAILFGVMLVLSIIYPLSKAKMKDMHDGLEVLRKNNQITENV